ncbi:hypothetical protein BpHYR1_020379, partial [Brachionus plicatilis]
LTSLEDRRKRGDLIQLFKFERTLNYIDWYHPLNKAPNTTGTGPAIATRSTKRKYRQLVKGCPPRHIEQSMLKNLTQNSKLINDNHYSKHHSSLHHATIFYNYIRHAADLTFSATHCNDSCSHLFK